MAKPYLEEFNEPKKIKGSVYVSKENHPLFWLLEDNIFEEKESNIFTQESKMKRLQGKDYDEENPCMSRISWKEAPGKQSIPVSIGDLQRRHTFTSLKTPEKKENGKNN